MTEQEREIRMWKRRHGPVFLNQIEYYKPIVPEQGKQRKKI